MRKLLTIVLSTLLISSVMAQDKPNQITALCKDGSYSTAKSPCCACVRHGGVEKWLVKPNAVSPKTDNKEKKGNLK